MVKKKSQSQVVASVLLILVTVVAVMVVLGFVVPFVQEQLSGTECLDIIGEFSIENNFKYTCYDTGGNLSLMVHKGDLENVTKGFQVVLSSGGSSNSFEIIDGKTEDDVLMFNGTGTLKVPGKNEEETYLINVSEKPESVEVIPILKNGDSCSEAFASTTQIPVCS